MASVVVIRDALHTAGAVVSAEEARVSESSSWARSATGQGARAGVVYQGVSTLLASTATTAPSMTVTVAPLHYVGQKAVGEGVYVGGSSSTVTVDVAAAPGSNSRIDVVYVMQRDSGSTTSPDASIQGEIGVITGTAGVTPAKPAIPVGAVEVGTVTVPAGATATTGCTIATTCKWTAPVGAPVPCRNASERTALTGYSGLSAYQIDTKQVWVYDLGSAGWNLMGPTALAAGASTTLAPGTQYGVGTFSVTEGSSVMSGGLDSVTFSQAGIVSIHVRVYIGDGTRTKQAMVVVGASNVAQTADWTLDRASLVYTARVTAGTTWAINQQITAGASPSTTATLTGMFFPSYA